MSTRDSAIPLLVAVGLILGSILFFLGFSLGAAFLLLSAY